MCISIKWLRAISQLIDLDWIWSMWLSRLRSYYTWSAEHHIYKPFCRKSWPTWKEIMLGSYIILWIVDCLSYPQTCCKFQMQPISSPRKSLNSVGLFEVEYAAKADLYLRIIVFKCMAHKSWASQIPCIRKPAEGHEHVKGVKTYSDFAKSHLKVFLKIMFQLLLQDLKAS